MRRVIFMALLTVTWLPAASGAFAQEYPLTPDPTACDAEPIDVEALVPAAAPAAAASPEAIPAERRIAGPSLQDELMVIVVGTVACTNANQPLRALSYFTEDYLLTRISDEPAVTMGHLEAAATRNPAVASIEDRVTIEVVENVTTWPSGAEVVLLWSSGDSELERVGLRFREVDGEWKIDEVIADDGE